MDTGPYSTPNHGKFIVWIARIAQYFRDTDNSSISGIALENYLSKDVTASRVTYKPNNEINQELSDILNDTTIPKSSNNQEINHILAELHSMQKIYTKRILNGQKYLGILGIFGSYTATEKLASVTKFLNNRADDLDPGAQQGKLGDLISRYQAINSGR